jgi:hypothetical protein
LPISEDLHASQMLDYFRGAQPLQTIDSENFRVHVIVTRHLRTMKHDCHIMT